MRSTTGYRVYRNIENRREVATAARRANARTTLSGQDHLSLVGRWLLLVLVSVGLLSTTTRSVRGGAGARALPHTSEGGAPLCWLLAFSRALGAVSVQ